MYCALFKPKNSATCSYVIRSKGPDKNVFHVSGTNSKYLASFRTIQLNLCHGVNLFFGKSGISRESTPAPSCSKAIVDANINLVILIRCRISSPEPLLSQILIYIFRLFLASEYSFTAFWYSNRTFSPTIIAGIVGSGVERVTCHTSCPLDFSCDNR